jgi:hypothetical protein
MPMGMGLNRYSGLLGIVLVGFIINCFLTPKQMFSERNPSIVEKFIGMGYRNVNANPFEAIGVIIKIFIIAIPIGFILNALGFPVIPFLMDIGKWWMSLGRH